MIIKRNKIWHIFWVCASGIYSENGTCYYKIPKIYLSQHQFSFISLSKFCLWNCSLQHTISKRKHYFYYQKRIVLWCFQFMKYVQSATKWNIAWRDATTQLSFFLKIQSYCHIIKTKRTENKRRRISYYIHCYC